MMAVLHRMMANSSNGGGSEKSFEADIETNVKPVSELGTGAVDTEESEQTGQPIAALRSQETPDNVNEGAVRFLRAPVWRAVGKALLIPVALLERTLNGEWLRKEWRVPWGVHATFAVFFGSQFAAAVMGQLSENLLCRILGSEIAGSELQRFVSRTAAYLTVALILEVFLSNQKKKLEENPFEMGRTSRWGQLKWVALWLAFRILWGGIASRGLVLSGMCEPPSAFPIERMPLTLEHDMRLGIGGEVVGGLSAETVAGIARFAGPLNSLLDVAVAPWFEEAFFRGFLQTSLASAIHPLGAIITTAFYQGLVFTGRLHQCSVRPTVLHPLSLLWRWGAESALAAVAYGFVYQRTRSLVPVVLLHQLEIVSKMLIVLQERALIGTFLKVALRKSAAGQ
ncbi:hypothetical protein KFL_001200130 [Klebsormidium nitens]|uniref:CAAX prenyl protease 2/Lysostaphin resistance protein A-like domain-containing protein n=1 Tax=Klebsormidium nitens TaxID=105231 RepID=A0A1Y1HZT3_KLENI|nr:hypothetical protein KFL_001200130 [Klebsormidium nitens]|eukprot:GAQ82689.1 hypothetical protein KFL_001200130 [Klebsormidium nitens]